MKKGMTPEEAFLTIIIFGIALIIFALLFKRIASAGQEEFTEKQCQASLLLTKLAGLSPTCVATPANPVPITCSRNYVSITDDIIEKNGRDVSDSYTGLCPGSGTDEKVSYACRSEEVVAEEMKRCWSMFFEGEQPVFQQLEINELSITPETNTRVCFVCTEVMLYRGAPKFGEYIKKTFATKEQTYFEYLTNKKAYCDPKLAQPTCWEGIAQHPELQKEGMPDGLTYAKINQDTLDEGRAYAVVFMRRGMGTCNEKNIDAKIGMNTNALTNTVQVVPADEIAKHCSAVIV